MEASDGSIFYASGCTAVEGDRCREQKETKGGDLLRDFQGPAMLALLALPLLAVLARGQVENFFTHLSSLVSSRWRIGACSKTSLRTWSASTNTQTTSTGDCKTAESFFWPEQNFFYPKLGATAVTHDKA